MKPRTHTHDWQWSEDRERYLCHCGESMLSEDTTSAAPPVVEPPKLEEVQCWSCLGSGYSDYAIGQPCTVCYGYGHWETIHTP